MWRAPANWSPSGRVGRGRIVVTALPADRRAVRLEEFRRLLQLRVCCGAPPAGSSSDGMNGTTGRLERPAFRHAPRRTTGEHVRYFTRDMGYPTGKRATD